MKPGEPVYIKERTTTTEFCPHCRAELSKVTGVADSMEHTIPEIGSITVCVECATILAIAEEGFRFATQGEWERIDPDLRACVQHVAGAVPVVRG
jgi:hypothetical protein